MRTTAIAIALMMSGAAIAQTPNDTEMNSPDMNNPVAADTMTTGPDAADQTMDHDAMGHSDMTTTDMSADPGMTGQTDMTTGTPVATVMTADVTPATSPIVQPGNDDPEHDARGIAVISAAASVPSGWNGLVATAIGGPLVDPATGETVAGADASYPSCTAEVTDNCVQTYEVGRS